MQEHQVAAARKQQLNDQIAELQRYRAVDAAELAALKARQGPPGAPGGADRAMADLKVAQEQMAELEAARAEARPRPLSSPDPITLLSGCCRRLALERASRPQGGTRRVQLAREGGTRRVHLVREGGEGGRAGRAPMSSIMANAASRILRARNARSAVGATCADG